MRELIFFCYLDTGLRFTVTVLYMSILKLFFFLYSKRLLRRNRELHLYHDIKPQLFSKPDRRFLILSLLLVNIAHVAFISYAYIVLKQ